MKEQRIIYCERDGCEAHQSTARPYGEWPDGWVVVNEFSEGSADPVAFCSVDCLLRHFAQREPATVIPWDDSSSPKEQ